MTSLMRGWVSVGVDHDTAEWAVETGRRWWRPMGSQVSPKAQRLLMTADGGGSTGSRCRLGKVEVQRLAAAIGLGLSVSTSHQERASGTRSSTGCAATSQSTGVVNRW